MEPPAAGERILAAHSGSRHIVDHEPGVLEPPRRFRPAPEAALTARRFLGVALLVGAYAPLHRLLDPAATGLAGSATRASAEAAWTLGLLGTAVVLGVAFVASRLIGPAPLVAASGRVVAALTRPSPFAFAVGLGLLTLALSLWIALGAYGGLPTSVDEMAQLLHAQALAAGRLALPLPADEAAWLIQNGRSTPTGWASVYPPLHTLLLAAGLRLGAAWAVGPVLIAMATALATSDLERLLGRETGRIGGVLLAVSPFWLSLGATHSSHTTAAAAIALVLWTGLRLRSGARGSWLLAGVAVGAAVAARPWIGLVASAGILIALAARARGPSAPPRGEGSPRVSRGFARLGDIAALVAGGTPFALLLFWWNSRLFGHPLRLGYSATFGPAHGLGFHTDPWGNRYGPLEALAFSGADLVQLGVNLLESPVPALALIGLGLIFGRRSAGSVVLGAWVAATLAANALYWHHGIQAGPRMLFESLPAWTGLLAVTATGLARGDGLPARVRVLGAWTIVFALMGSALLAPRTLARRFEAGPVGPVAVPSPPDDEPALVFVHGSWSSRVASRLAAAGMRRDSVETALRRNDLCDLSRYASWRAGAAPAGAGPPPMLNLTPEPGSPPGLEIRSLSPGNFARLRPGPMADPACLREARADRLGVIELEPLLWRLPPVADRAVTVVVRDLGPATNARVLEALERRAWVYIEGTDGGGPRLIDYREGMALLWGGAAAPLTGGG